jgi:hypothetical protein
LTYFLGSILTEDPLRTMDPESEEAKKSPPDVRRMLRPWKRRKVLFQTDFQLYCVFVGGTKILAYIQLNNSNTYLQHKIRVFYTCIITPSVPSTSNLESDLILRSLPMSEMTSETSIRLASSTSRLELSSRTWSRSKRSFLSFKISEEAEDSEI